jgi:hypothetical protein
MEEAHFMPTEFAINSGFRFGFGFGRHDALTAEAWTRARFAGFFAGGAAENGFATLFARADPRWELFARRFGVPSPTRQAFEEPARLTF